MNPLLAGIRIIDLSRLLPAPFCTQYLAQLGAEVIKVEEPAGDYARSMSAEMFTLINRGKRSVVLDLKKPDDVAALKALVRDADEIGRAHVRTQVTNAHIVCRILLEKKK